MFSNPLACKGDLETTETCKEKSKILGDACRRLEDEKNVISRMPFPFFKFLIHFILLNIGV